MNAAASAGVPTRRRIGVVTTSRADYSHLYWPLRELAANPEIELSVEGNKVHAEARIVLDAQELADVLERFRSKYGKLETYYRKLDTAIAVTI